MVLTNHFETSLGEIWDDVELKMAQPQVESVIPPFVSPALPVRRWVGNFCEVWFQAVLGGWGPIGFFRES